MSNVFQVFIQPIKNIRSCIIAHVTNVRDFCDSYMTSKIFTKNNSAASLFFEYDSFFFNFRIKIKDFGQR